jgi:DNA-binding NtrC family response regulator
MNILVIDDEREICQVFKIRLEQEGMVVMTAMSLEEAMAKSKLLKFDVILTDLLLSRGERGDEFAREYKKRNPWTRVFVFSGSEDAQIVPGLKPYKIFSKPLDFELVIEALNDNIVEHPSEITEDSVKLDDRDAHLLMELVNKVVEHTNIVATTQSLITENLEELANSQERVEEKNTYIYTMLKAVDESGILKMYSTIRNFISVAAGKIFWALVLLFAMFMIKGPILKLVTDVLHK